MQYTRIKHHTLRHVAEHPRIARRTPSVLHTHMSLPFIRNIATTRGVTLVELLVAFALVSIALTVSVRVFLVAVDRNTMHRHQLQVSAEASAILDELVRQARVSDDMVVVYGDGTDTANRRITFYPIPGLNGQAIAPVEFVWDATTKKISRDGVQMHSDDMVVTFFGPTETQVTATDDLQKIVRMSRIRLVVRHRYSLPAEPRLELQTFLTLRSV